MLSPKDRSKQTFTDLGRTRGDTATLTKRATRNRKGTQAKLKGKVPLQPRYIAPPFARVKRQQASYNPYKGGKASHLYKFFVVVDVLQLRESEPLPPPDYIESTSNPREIAPLGVAPLVHKSTHQVRQGARQRVSLTVPVTMTLSDFRKRGLPKRLVRDALNRFDREGNMFYVVERISGVWRAKYSEQEALHRRRT